MCIVFAKNLGHKKIQDDFDVSIRNRTALKVEIAVAQWLRCCATNRKVAGSIPDGVIGIFH